MPRRPLQLSPPAAWAPHAAHASSSTTGSTRYCAHCSWQSPGQWCCHPRGCGCGGLDSLLRSSRDRTKRRGSREGSGSTLGTNGPPHRGDAQLRSVHRAPSRLSPRVGGAERTGVLRVVSEGALWGRWNALLLVRRVSQCSLVSRLSSLVSRLLSLVSRLSSLPMLVRHRIDQVVDSQLVSFGRFIDRVEP